MRKKFIYCLGVLIAFILGVLIMCAVIYKYPNEVVKTITEKNVSITDTGIAEAVEKIESATVVVQVYERDTLLGTGTGFVYDKDDKYAYIMTNHHVIEDAGDIKITYSDDSVTTASIVGSDEYADIAVLKVDKDTILNVATLGKSEDVRKGDTVFTIGSPMGIDFKGTVTRGILSGKDRLVSVSLSGGQSDWIMNVMQTDAAISPGNSGGPLCNVNGEVIGINSLKIVEDTVESIGFSIPIEDAINYANDLRNYGSISRPYIGVSMVNASSRMQLLSAGIRLDSDILAGVVIVDVENNSPASDAGLTSGDVIVRVGDDEVTDIAEFRYRLYSYNPDDKVTLTIIRDGKSKEIKVKLGSNS